MYREIHLQLTRAHARAHTYTHTYTRTQVTLRAHVFVCSRVREHGQVYTLACTADRLRENLVRVGAKEWVNQAMIKFRDDSLVAVSSEENAMSHCCDVYAN